MNNFAHNIAIKDGKNMKKKYNSSVINLLPEKVQLQKSEDKRIALVAGM